MSPENIKGTNIWNLLKGEEIEGTDGRIVKGPQTGIRISKFKEVDLMLAQLADGSRFEINGTDFEKSVKKTDSQ